MLLILKKSNFVLIVSSLCHRTNNEKSKSSMWLVAPLVSKLPPAVQGRILRVAGQVLESTNMFSVKTKENTVTNNGNVNAGSNSNSNSNSGSNQNGNSNSSFVNSANNNSNSQNFTNGVSGKHKTNQINHQPFLGLVLACLKGQDEQKEGLLQSLHTQLSQFLQNKDVSKTLEYICFKTSKPQKHSFI